MILECDLPQHCHYIIYARRCISALLKLKLLSIYWHGKLCLLTLLVLKKLSAEKVFLQLIKQKQKA